MPNAHSFPPETVRERRGRIMTAVDDAAVSMRTAPACRALGLPRASLYRGRRPAAVARPRLGPAPCVESGQASRRVGSLAHRFVDQAPGEIRERRDQVRRPQRYRAREECGPRSARVCLGLTRPRPQLFPSLRLLGHYALMKSASRLLCSADASDIPIRPGRYPRAASMLARERQCPRTWPPACNPKRCHG